MVPALQQQPLYLPDKLAVSDDTRLGLEHHPLRKQA